MNITSQLDRYLGVRRSLGYDLRTDERVLRRFARFTRRADCCRAVPGENIPISIAIPRSP